MLHISEGLSLPDDFVTQASAILARRGAGKTYTGSVIAEEAIGHKLPVVILDPTGAWWGLRSSADGTKPGLPVVILGGEHRDVPLESTAGSVIAEVVVEHPGAYILDLSSFESNASQDRFVADFLERLYRLKAKHPEALLLIVDEADSFAPQRPGPKQLRMLGAMEAIVRRGRIRGLGVLLITQRAAVLNKNCLTQSEVIIAMQTTSPQDRAAIDAWVEYNATRDKRAEVMESLASLQRGEAWIWSPSWMRILKRTTIRVRRTFDSSATPEAGVKAVQPQAFAKVDLAALGERIAATVEHAQENDPLRLKAKMRDLEAALKGRPVETQIEHVVDYVEKPIVTHEQLVELEAALGRAGEIVEVIERLVGAARQLVPTATLQVDHLPGPSVELITPRQNRARSARVFTDGPVPLVVDGKTGLTYNLSRSETAILNVLAQFESRTKAQIAILSGYSPTSGGFFGALANLRRLNLMEGPPDRVTITEAGRQAAGPVEPLPDDLLSYWMAKLPKADGALLGILVSDGPMTKARLAEISGYSPTSGGFFGALAKLRKLELISGDSNNLVAAEIFR